MLTISVKAQLEANQKAGHEKNMKVLWFVSQMIHLLVLLENKDGSDVINMVG